MCLRWCGRNFGCAQSMAAMAMIQRCRRMHWVCGWISWAATPSRGLALSQADAWVACSIRRAAFRRSFKATACMWFMKASTPAGTTQTDVSYEVRGIRIDRSVPTLTL